MKHMILRFVLAMPIALLVLDVAGADVRGADHFTNSRGTAFDADWRFLRADATAAETPGYDDSAWRRLDLPHDWSIDDLPSTNGAPPSPFDPAHSAGGASTGFVVGGTGWYRKHFTLPAATAGKNVTICFDGVYMNAEVWLNGHHLGNHPYGYTSFVFDLTPWLQPAGQENILAVEVRNVGKNSRWYSGSGIYRHVWLAVADPAHIPFYGLHVLTTNLSPASATVSVLTTVENDRNADAAIRLRTRLIAPDGKATKPQEIEIHVPAGQQQEFTQEFSVTKPALWSLDNPALYRAEVELVDNQKSLDQAGTTFGIRTLSFSVTNGFELNGEMVKLKGGCVHNDNGPLGSATIDRAEERRVQLLKAYGFNAIRTSHNPPSPAFLDACDRYGVLVMDEAFDYWEEGKNPNDYGKDFDAWWQRDLDSMLLRDRNHPSIILWSIGNEIPQRAKESGYVIAKNLSDEVHRLDATRPVTEAVCALWDGRPWSATEKTFSFLDVSGYNYQWRQYGPDHLKFPARIMLGTESYPRELFDNWQAVLTNSWVIGDFVWTGLDYLGETGIGNAIGNTANRYPWFDAWCGDIDICGFKKPQLYYREVVWGNTNIALAVHAPLPEGRAERVSGWGWPDERQCWTWPGSEGKPLDVTVYSSCQSVRLELDGKEIATERVNNRMIAKFKVPYQPGELRAIGLTDARPVANASLRTAEEPREIRLTADRSAIRADRNDLSYVTVELVDRRGTVVPTAELPIRFTVTGAGELAATGSPAPNDASSFHLPVRKTFEGRCLAILRPVGNAGKITLKAEADGIKAATIVIKTR